MRIKFQMIPLIAEPPLVCLYCGAVIILSLLIPFEVAGQERETEVGGSVLLEKFLDVTLDTAAFPQVLRDTKNKAISKELDSVVKAAQARLESELKSISDRLSTGITLAQLVNDYSRGRRTFPKVLTMYSNPRTGKPTLDVSTRLSYACRIGNLNVDLAAYTIIQGFVSRGELEFVEDRRATSCMQIEPFPHVVITEDYASHLLGFIDTLLKTYPSLKATLVQYKRMENQNCPDNLSSRIYFRMRFIKVCYQRI